MLRWGEWLLSRRDSMTVARRFIAGVRDHMACVPGTCLAPVIWPEKAPPRRGKKA